MMQERICPNCGHAWYSSAAEQVWACETCGAEVGPECATRGDGTGVGWAGSMAVCLECGKTMQFETADQVWFVPYSQPCVYDAATDHVVDHPPCGRFVVRRQYGV